jgi:serine phosphatase RsbU (regulator of sigma subunit)
MTGKTIPVLLIEDNPGDARLIREMLAETGDVRFELTTVPSLQEGQRCLAEGGFAVLLLDLSLPDSHGLDTFRAVRSTAANLPVVVLTGLSDTGAALQAVNEGAQDFLVKNDVTGARLAHALRYAISRNEIRNSLLGAHQANEAELQLAQKIQQRLLPRRAPELPGFDIHGATYPAARTGGDYFDYLKLGDGSVGIVVADVTGHGVGPGLLMAATRAYLRAFAGTIDDIGAVLRHTNEQLLDDQDDRPVTLILARLDGAARQLVHSSAGHWPGYVLSASGDVRHHLLATGFALGMEHGERFNPGPLVQLAAGDLVLLLTDGILEAGTPPWRMFGEERALDHVRAHRHESARAIVEGLYAEVRRWEGAQAQGDDITAVVIKVLG